MMKLDLSRLEAPIPRPLLWIGVPLAGLFFTGLFLFAGFPYDALGRRVASGLEQANGSPVEFAAIRPRLTIGGPGLRIEDLRLHRDAGRVFRIESLAVRPAWSLAWLRAHPVLHIDAHSGIGRLNGTLEVGGEPRWIGSLRDIDLKALPLPASSDFGVAGKLDAEADLRIGTQSVRGAVQLSVSKGSFSHASLPMEIPFESLQADLEFGEPPHLVQIRAFSLDGPVIAARSHGRIDRDSERATRPLDLEFELEIRNPALRALIGGFGLPLDDRGRASAHLTGSLEHPEIH